MSPPTIFVIVRRDLPVGKRDAQEVHAAYAIGRASKPDDHPFPYAIVLAARDEAHLADLEALFQGRGMKSYVRIQEPEMGNSLTALAFGPVPKSEGRFLSALPTLKEPKPPHVAQQVERQTL